jgi:hypothetical protein
MAKRGEDVIEFIPAQIEGDFEDENTRSTSLEDELKESLKDADDTAEVLLYRQKTANHKDGMSICETWSADIVTWSLIQKTARGYIVDPYNDTYFRIIIRKGGKIREHKPFSLAGKTHTPDALPAKGNNDTRDILNTLVQMQREQMADLQRMMIAERESRVDPKESMKEMFLMMGMMREAMGYSPQAQQVQQVQQAGAIDQLIGTLAGLAKLKGLAGELGFMGATDVTPEPDNVLSLATKYLPSFLDVVKRNQDIKAAELQSAVLQHNPAPAPAPAPAPVDPLEELRPVVAQLQLMAKADEDFTGVVEYVAANADIAAKLKPVLDAPNPFELLAKAFPEVLAYPSWYADLIDALKEALTKPALPVDTPAHEPHNATINP